MESLQAHVHAESRAGRERAEDSGALPVRHLGAQHEHQHSAAERTAGAERERSRECGFGRDGGGVHRAVVVARSSRLLTLIMTVPAIVAGTGCYQYRDARLTDLRPDATVHVVL